MCKLFDTAGVLPKFEEGNYTSAYPYLVMVNTASQCWVRQSPCISPASPLHLPCISPYLVMVNTA